MRTKAVVLLSGGQDSVTSLFWAMQTMDCFCLSIKYGQRHEEAEIAAARKITEKYSLHHEVVEVPAIKQLTQGVCDLVTEGSIFSIDGKRPSSFIPGRNAIFIGLAAGYASTIGADSIVIGVCEADYSGYPDCRKAFIESMKQSISLALDETIHIRTPLMHLTKAEIFALADNLGILDDILSITLTCYNGSDLKHDWGQGCGECPSCLLREKGWNQFMERRGTR